MRDARLNKQGLTQRAESRSALPAALFQVGEIVEHQSVDETVGASHTFEEYTFACVIQEYNGLPGEAI